jgi:3-methyladenine DNA glycosylase AlkD
MAPAANKPGSYRDLRRELKSLADPDRAAILQRFFKTRPGEYGEGDRFLGIPVPVQRRTALRYRDIPLRDIARLLESPIHEERLCALEILVWQYEHADEQSREEIFNFYLANTAGINNWDLVDASAPYIVGAHLADRPHGILTRLAASENIWERRIAIVSTFGLIRRGNIDVTFRIARKLLSDKHDLIHKAVGWALRETGKISEARLTQFLERHFDALPRTALRYAIERFPASRRKRMLAGDFSD